MAPALERLQHGCARQLASLLDGAAAAVCLAADDESESTLAACTELV